MKKLIDLVRLVKRKIKESWIRDDYLTVIRCKLYLQVHENENFEVVKKNYLIPGTTHLVLPLQHPDGLYKYYEGIAEGLTYLLKVGYPNFKISNSRPPRYVTEFAKDNPMRINRSF
jgi:hypothetical protein